MAIRIFFLIFSMVLFGPCYAQTDSLHRVLTKPRPSENFPFSDIARQISRYYKRKFAGEYYEKSRHDHCIDYSFGKMMDFGDGSDSSYTSSIEIPYIKNEYFFGDLDGDGTDEIIAPIEVLGDRTGGNIQWTEYFVFKWVNKKYRIASVTETADIPVLWTGAEVPAYFKIKSIANGVVYGYANCYTQGDEYNHPTLFLATSHRYIKNKWVLRSTRKLKKIPKVFEF